MDQPIHLGAAPEAIQAAEQELGVVFPDVLKEIWLTSNGLEIPPDWAIYPIYDPNNPRKTCNSIVYENTPGKGRWDYDSMPSDLVVIAGNGSGNHLVLLKSDGILQPEVLCWNHETHRTRAWSRSLDYVLGRARARVSAIEKARAKAPRPTTNRPRP